MRLHKSSEGYKITKNNWWDFILRKPHIFKKASLNRGESEPRDLVFSSKMLALKYLENERKETLSEEDYLFAAQVQLETIFKSLNINSQKYEWADLWTGRMHWAVVLSRLLQKKVFAIDCDSSSYGDRIQDHLVEFKELDTEVGPLPLETSAAFLRSSITTSAIKKILDLNPQLDLLVIIPEGLTSNENMKFNSELKVLSENFEEVQSSVLSSEFTIKGSHSNILTYNRSFPVLIGRARKKL